MIELVNPKTHAVIPDPQVNAVFLVGSILLWSLNTLGTSFIHFLGLNKNISALLVIPLLVMISYFFQKRYVFK